MNERHLEVNFVESNRLTLDLMPPTSIPSNEFTEAF